jgi:hypothetical protein
MLIKINANQKPIREIQKQTEKPKLLKTLNDFLILNILPFLGRRVPI